MKRELRNSKFERPEPARNRSVLMEDSVWELARTMAKTDRVSMHQFIKDAIMEKALARQSMDNFLSEATGLESPLREIDILS